MKVKPYKEEVVQLILQYLEHDLGEAEIAAKLKKKHVQNIPSWVLENNELLKKGLTKVIKAYVQMDKRIKQYYVSRKAPQQSQEEQVQQKMIDENPKSKKQRKSSIVSNGSAKNQQKPKPKKNAEKQKPKGHDQNTTNWVKSKFEPPKRLEQIGKEDEPIKIIKNKKPSMIAHEASSQESSDRPLHSDHSDEQVVAKLKKYDNKDKKDKKTTTKKPVKKVETQSQEQSEQSQQQPKPTKKSKKEVKKQLKQQKQTEKAEKAQQKARKNSQQKTHKMHTRLDDHKQHEHEQEEVNSKNQYNNKNNHPFSSFSRIKVHEVGPIKTQLQDNSFEAKFKFGQGGDQWGKYGHERLKDTRGDSFKKTKDKLKNKAYQGGTIDINVINSIPLD